LKMANKNMKLQKREKQVVVAIGIVLVIFVVGYLVFGPGAFYSPIDAVSATRTVEENKVTIEVVVTENVDSLILGDVFNEGFEANNFDPVLDDDFPIYDSEEEVIFWSVKDVSVGTYSYSYDLEGQGQTELIGKVGWESNGSTYDEGTGSTYEDYIGGDNSVDLGGTTGDGTEAGTVDVDTGTGGGGGGGATAKTYSPTEEELNQGYFQKLAEKDKVLAKIEGEDHSVSVVDIKGDSVEIEVASTPQKVTLNVGDEKKFDLDGDGDYDLLVKVDSIQYGKANLVVTKIFEPIDLTDSGGDSEDTGSEADNSGDGTGTGEQIGEDTSKVLIYLITGIIVLGIIIGIVYYRKKRMK
jgi:hypothetical protein